MAVACRAQGACACGADHPCEGGVGVVATHNQHAGAQRQSACTGQRADALVEVVQSQRAQLADDHRRVDCSSAVALIWTQRAVGAQGQGALCNVRLTGKGAGAGQCEGGVAHLAQAAVATDDACKRQVVAVDFELTASAQSQRGHAGARALDDGNQALAFAIQVKSCTRVDGQGRCAAEGLVDSHAQGARLHRGGARVDAVARKGERAGAGLDDAAKVIQGAAEVGTACAVVGARSKVVHTDGQPRVGEAAKTHLHGARAGQGVDADIGLDRHEDRSGGHIETGQVVRPVFVGR